ncbi:hypothetical protein [Cryobacterium sp. BB307]|uniref:hypothetical protein n=1 Tax=Cryobacterium sp. BB307 TaxID=2716317 RepID=UPI001445DA69|nr:hypothetical protein [Cryobacterium sp. BB307]
MSRGSTTVVSTVVGACVSAALLAGCTGDDSAPASSPTSSASTSAAPTPSPTASPVTLPTDCASLGTDETRTAVLAGLNFHGGDYTQFVRPAPDSARLVLGCDWFAGDATGLLVLISTASPADVAAAAAGLTADGFTCASSDSGAQRCELVTPHSQYPVDVKETIVARDGVWVYMESSNLDGTPLLDEIVQGIFG